MQRIYHQLQGLENIASLYLPDSFALRLILLVTAGNHGIVSADLQTCSFPLLPGYHWGAEAPIHQNS